MKKIKLTNSSAKNHSFAGLKAYEALPSELHFLAEALHHLHHTTTLGEILDSLVEIMHALLPNYIVVLSENDEATGSYTLEAWAGVKSSMEKLTDVIGFDPSRTRFSLTHLQETDFHPYRNEKIHRMENGLFSLFQGKLSVTKCERLARTLDVKEVYTIGISRNNFDYGGMALLSKTREEVESKAAVVQMIMNQASAIVSRMKTVESFRANEDSFRKLNDHLPLVIARMSRDLKYVYINRGIEMITGQKPGDYIGKTIEELKLSPENRKLWDQNLNKAFRTGKSCSFEFITNKAKKEISFLARLFPETDKDGTAQTVLILVQDITENKQVQKALQESEERFRMLFENAPVGYQSLDSEGRFLEVNETWLDLLGYPKEKIIGKWFGDFLVPRYQGAFRERFQLFKQQGSIHSEFEMVKRNGSVMFAAFEGRIGHTPDGRFLQTHCVLNDITEQKKAEQALIESERILSTLMSNLPGMVYRSRNAEKHSFEFVSEGCREITGVAPEMLISQKVSYNNLIHPDDRVKVRNSISRALSKGIPYQLVYRLTDMNGQLRWVSEQGQGILGPLDHIPTLVGFVYDITDQMKTREALQESEEIFSKFMEYSPIYLYFKDQEGKAIHLSRNFEQMLGRPMEDILGKNMDELFPSEMARTMMEDDQTIIQQGLPVRRTEKLQDRVYESVKFPIKRPGKPNLLAGYIIDVTEREKAEKELESSINLLNNILESSADAIYVKDVQQRIILCNKAYALPLNKPYSACIGKTDSENGWSTELVKGNIEKGIRGFEAEDGAALKGEIVHIPNEYVMIGNEGYYFDTIKLPLRNKDDEIVGMFGISRNITERKKTEERIQGLNLELEQRVSERTSQLLTSNKELESFAYSVSHDLRAPLRAIDGFSQLVMQDYHDKLDDEGKIFLSRIRSGAQQMARLIDDILNLSRVTRAEMNLQPVSLTHIAHDVIRNLRAEEPERKVEFQILPDVIVAGDPIMLQSVMENLLRNAWKFTGKHSSARIEFGFRETEGRKVYFVKDDGAGFDMKYAEKLFGPFQRLHASSEFPGTGVGLATVQRIISRHGGKVWATGESEKGATFFFTIS